MKLRNIGYLIWHIRSYCVWGALLLLVECSSSTEPETDPEKEQASAILEGLDSPENYYVVRPEPNGGETRSSDYDSNEIVVALHGGPQYEISTDAFSCLHEEFDIAYVYQTQNIDSSVIDLEEVLSPEEADEVNLKSAVYAYHVVKHFKDQGKRVYVLSHSFGSFIYPKAIQIFGNLADKTIIAAGRLEMPDIIWNDFTDGYPGNYENDGMTYQRNPVHIRDNPDALSMFDVDNYIDGWNSARLLGSYGKNRYISLLRDVALGDDFLYIHGLYDKRTGRLSENEVSFLQNKSVCVLTLESGHSVNQAFGDEPHYIEQFFRETLNPCSSE